MKKIFLFILFLSFLFLTSCETKKDMIENNQSDISTIQTKLIDLSNKVDLYLASIKLDYTNSINGIKETYNKEISNLNSDIAENTNELTALVTKLENDKTILKDSYDLKIANLSANIATNSKEIDDLETEYKAKIKELDDNYITDKATIINSINDKETKISVLSTKLDDEISKINTKYDTELIALQATYNSSLSTLQGEINTNTSSISSLDQKLFDEISALKTLYDRKITDLKASYDDEILNIKASIQTNTDAINNLTSILESCTPGKDADQLELRYDNGYIQWKRVPETDWNNLVSISELFEIENEVLNGEYTIDSFTYKVENGVASIISYSDLDETAEIVIPEYIQIEGVQIPIKYICSYAFNQNVYLTRININANLQKISMYSFNQCPNLGFLDINGTVSYIESKVLFECKNTYIRLNGPIKYIDEFAFYGWVLGDSCIYGELNSQNYYKYSILVGIENRYLYGYWSSGWFDSYIGIFMYNGSTTSRIINNDYKYNWS